VLVGLARPRQTGLYQIPETHAETSANTRSATPPGRDPSSFKRRMKRGDKRSILRIQVQAAREAAVGLRRRQIATSTASNGS